MNDASDTDQTARIVALIGNPNSGKTTLFNALTGLHHKVGNYPGVTVEKKEGRVPVTGGGSFTLLDLPGTYSLHAQSPDERVATDIAPGPDRPHARPASGALRGRCNQSRTEPLSRDPGDRPPSSAGHRAHHERPRARTGHRASMPALSRRPRLPGHPRRRTERRRARGTPLGDPVVPLTDGHRPPWTLPGAAPA